MNEAVEFQPELYADYLNFERGLSPLTVSAYGRELERFIAFATERGRPDPSSVGGDDVRDYVHGKMPDILCLPSGRILLAVGSMGAVTSFR